MILITLIFNLAFGATPTAREWLKLPLNGDSFFRDMMPPATEAIIIPTVRDGFLPPVQYLERHVQGTDEEDRARIRIEVLTAMRVNPFAKSTVDIDFAPFKAGERRDLPATLTQVQSAGPKEASLTCYAIVRDGDLLRVIYTTGFQASLTDCKTPFVEISRSSALTRK